MKKLKTILIFLTILAIATVGFVLFNHPRQAGASWWNDSWSYRQAIPVTNNTSAQADVYISLTLDTNTASTSMQADCGDFRFTTEAGEVLPYYLVSGCRSVSNVIHVNFNSFPAGAQTVYFYYGNATAENGFSASDFTTEASNYTIGEVQTVETGPGPVGYWSFDEGYGATAHDESGQGNNGTITGAAWKGEEECVSGKCLYFDDASDEIETPDSENLTISEEISMSFWVKPLDLSDNFKIILNKGSYNWESNYHVYQDYNDIIFAYTGTINNQYKIENVFSTSSWVHIGISHTFGESSSIRIYIDGSLKSGTWMMGGSEAPTLDTDEGFSIGHADPSGESFLGYIDEVKIYPYARTADQIKQDYNAGMAGQGLAQGAAATFGSVSGKWLTDGLIGYWKFDEAVGSYDGTDDAPDSSGNGNTGNVSGSADAVSGKFGNALQVTDGNYMEFADSSIWTWTPVEEDRNFSFWIKSSSWPDGAGEYASFFILNESGATNNHKYQLSAYHSGSGLGLMSCTYDDSWSPTGCFYTSFSPATSTWYHLAVNASAEGNSKIFLDGVEQDVTYAYGWDDNTVIDPNPGDGGFVGFGDPSNTDDNFTIDDFRIYNRALSQDEVKKLYEWAPGPVAHWKFDELSGTTAYDSVASSSTSGGNDGTISEATWVNGKYGGALDFSATNARVIVPHNEKIGINGQISIGLWVKPYDISVDYTRFIEKNNYATSYFFGLNTGVGDLAFWHNNTEALDTGDVLIENVWQYVAMSYDGSEVNIFYNGANIASGAYSGIASGNTSDLKIGYFASGSTRNFNGIIDDVRIYNYARTQKQILEDMAASAPGASASQGLAQKHPVLHLSFDEGRGGTAYDSSIHGNNGLLYPGTQGDNTSSSSMWAKDGKMGGAMEFDGMGDYVDFDVDIQDYPFTLSAWAKPSEFVTGSVVDLADSSSASMNYNIGVTVDGKARLFARNTMIYNIYGPTVIDDGNWHLLTGVFRSATDRELFLDGVSEGTDNNTVTFFAPNTSSVGMARDLTPSNSFDGLIDEVKIWNYALSEDEIKTEYNAGVSAGFAVEKQADNNGTAVSGKAAEYCVPGDTATCSPPVLELKFDELSGTSTYDSSGNGNDGVFVSSGSSPAWSLLGKKGGALEFDGADDYVELDPPMGVETTLSVCDSDHTISAWFRSSDLATKRQIYAESQDGSSFSGFSLHLTTTGTINYNIFIDGDPWELEVETSSSYDDDRFHFVAATRNSDTYTVYVDGFYVDSSTISNQPYCSEDAIDIGRNTTTSGPENYFNGLIDDVRIYDYARTPAQIAWDYNRGKPIAHWSFDECSGGTIHDDSGNGNHGQLYLGTSGTTATGTCASSSDSFWYNGRSGKYNSSGSFDGGSDYVSITHTSALMPSQFSLAFWFMAENIDNDHQVILGKLNSSINQGYTSGIIEADDIIYGHPGELWFGTYRSGGQDYIFSGPILENIWYHATGIFDGTNLKLYINGELKSVVSGTIVANNTDPVVIGQWYNSLHYDGQLDEVKIWNYALTEEQVKNEYNGGAVRFGN